MQGFIRATVGIAHVALVTTLLPACGRIGYDPLDQSGRDAGLAPDAGATPDAGAAPDYCAELPALAAVPVIDGQLDPGLVLRPLTPVAWTGAGVLPAGQHAAYAAAWRPDGLYIYVEVVDPDRVPAAPGQFRWCGDGVELYVDADGSYASPPAYDDPGTRQLIVGAPADAITAVHGGEAWCPSCGDTVPRDRSGSAFISVPRADGYAFEAHVLATDLDQFLWTPGAGEALGIDLAVNVSASLPTGLPCISDGSSAGSRVGSYYLRVSANAPVFPYDTVDAFCTPTLRP